MKYCSRCGKEIVADAVICPHCGCAVEKRKEDDTSHTLRVIAFVFLILSCIAYGWLLIPLAWLIPFTIKVKKAVDDPSYELSTALKVCILIFGNLVSGIVLLCDNG